MAQEKNTIVYTHDDVLRMMCTFHTLQLNIDLCMCKLTPIEIPSDEEIDAHAHKVHDDLFNEFYAYTDGAKWMRDKILNK